MDIKDLYSIAANEIQKINQHKLRDFRLEEVEQQGKDWRVVVSYLTPNLNRPDSPLLAASSVSENLPYERVYKWINITEEGKVLGIYMHDK